MALATGWMEVLFIDKEEGKGRIGFFWKKNQELYFLHVKFEIPSRHRGRVVK